jgi:hypothetical protein
MRFGNISNDLGISMVLFFSRTTNSWLNSIAAGDLKVPVHLVESVDVHDLTEIVHDDEDSEVANLGEIQIDHDDAKVKVTTELRR